jgi:N4-gp56 family major capsid protein
MLEREVEYFKMYQTIKELAESQASDVQGTTVGTKYGLQPIQYLKEIVDAAQNQLFFANFCQVIVAPEGVHDVVIPKRSKYQGRSGMSFDTTERIGNDITWTTMDNLSSIIATPSPVLAGYGISNYALRTNAINLLQAARDELSYAIGDRLDQAIAVAIGNATASTSSAAGAQTIFGGDATADSGLTNGDVINTDIVAKAARYLKDTVCRYWSGGSEANSSATKNAWNPTAGEPFVLFIAPAQEEAFKKDSQFVNAAEYGGNQIVQNGEIGQYLGIRIISSVNVEGALGSAIAPDGTTMASGVNMHRCIMMKAKRACAVVWGQQPTIKVFDYPTRDQTRITLVCAYQIKVIHDDAIVWIDVTDT